MSRPSGPLWRLSEIGEALKANMVAAHGDVDIQGISIDSRTLHRGDLFIALDGESGPLLRAGKGAGHDGHDFVVQAADKGAAAAMVHRSVRAKIPLLEVANTREGLWQLGEAARARSGAVVFAVTGSAGKTTAKTMLAAVTQGFATAGSLNNVWGVPLSLARTPRDAPSGIYEIGMNAPGEIAPLARLVRPHVALVLNALPAHLSELGSVDAVRQEKLSIFAGLEAGGTLVLPADMDAELVPKQIVRFRFGRSSKADLVYSPIDESWQAIDIACAGQRLEAMVPGGGEHRAETVAAVAASAIAAGYSLTSLEQLSEVALPAGRGRELKAGGVTILDDSYNANPVSMGQAIGQLAKRRGRRLALLGEMLELGDAAEDAHLVLAEQAGTLDGLWCVGEGTRPTADALPPSIRLGWYPEASDALLDAVVDTLEEGDCLLVKGSNRVFWARGFVKALEKRLNSSA